MSFKSIGQVTPYKALAKCGMEELAIRQRNIIASGGVLFARNADGEQKNAARQHVIDLFHPDRWSGRLNMLTMPGVHWRFERKLLGVREAGWMQRKHPQRTHFTGVENDRSIYFAAVTQMPGVETPNALIKPVKRDKFPFAELAIKSRHASFFFANMDDVLSHKWESPAYREEHLIGWDAAWLDYTGPLTVERLEAISRFYYTYVRSVLIVTALKARWNRKTSAAINKAEGYSAWLRVNLVGEVLHEIFGSTTRAELTVSLG
jgi:hypothetical protein